MKLCKSKAYKNFESKLEKVLARWMVPARVKIYLGKIPIMVNSDLCILNSAPPELKYLTNNGKTRFNPNLYRNGKVCISILNTWKGEQWTSCQTIRSVLLTLITLFHNKPLLNEPGINENHRDFKNYNDIIRYRNYETAILRVASQKLLPAVFVDAFCIIKKHLTSNKKSILEKLQKEHTLRPPRTINCGIYTMKCSINYLKLYEEMSIVLSNYN